MTSSTHWLHLWHHIGWQHLCRLHRFSGSCRLFSGFIHYTIYFQMALSSQYLHDIILVSFWRHMTSFILYASPQVRWGCTDWDIFKSLKNRSGRIVHCSEFAERVAQSHGALSLSLMVWRTTAAAAEQKIRIKYIGNWVKQRAHYIHTPWF